MTTQVHLWGYPHQLTARSTKIPDWVSIFHRRETLERSHRVAWVFETRGEGLCRRHCDCFSPGNGPCPVNPSLILVSGFCDSSKVLSSQEVEDLFLLDGGGKSLGLFCSPQTRTRATGYRMPFSGSNLQLLFPSSSAYARRVAFLLSVPHQMRPDTGMGQDSRLLNLARLGWFFFPFHGQICLGSSHQPSRPKPFPLLSYRKFILAAPSGAVLPY